ncbi:MAG: Uma2 family endonuclease [Planctomycetes bacterium]|nr:Uma2 family endonuclease [Planctomycetota bacterium]
MSTATITIGPEHDGQRMPLEEFDAAAGREGYLYELSRGVITVIDLPNDPHFDFVDAIQDQLRIYKASNPAEIFRILEGSSGKISIASSGSERHPDLLLYKSRRPANVKGRQVWKVWIPDLVIEVVSPESADRDYNEKPDEYFQFGVSEYWIIDGSRQLMTVYQRSGGEWQISTIAPGVKHVTHLFPGFEFDLKRVFDAANE